MNNSHQRFINALKINQQSFNVSLSTEKIKELAVYYELVQEHNQFLHLVAPCSPEEFVVRHILESLTLLEFLPKNAKFADVGAGAGLPSIPCLILREDLHGILIESKLKKADFLQEVLAICKLNSRAEILNRQFEELERGDVCYVLCRALDKFTQKLSKLLKWSGNCTLLFFGGNALREELKKYGVKFEEKLMPLSEQRFLFVSAK
ncbi:MAG: 16S rRNA (guanine(527)-N(7))-methyltransferase RsmG [Acidobacteria bacterium]|jgi:16S rRNA (guanine527-N7)-methyltransferase|nr:16S rRNA (guanine(527)-N(7))-methyltransferase RsmG [Acidobacteriota bacterium]